MKALLIAGAALLGFAASSWGITYTYSGAVVTSTTPGLSVGAAGSAALTLDDAFAAQLTEGSFFTRYEPPDWTAGVVMSISFGSSGAYQSNPLTYAGVWIVDDPSGDSIMIGSEGFGGLGGDAGIGHMGLRFFDPSGQAIVAGQSIDFSAEKWETIEFWMGGSFRGYHANARVGEVFPANVPDSGHTVSLLLMAGAIVLPFAARWRLQTAPKKTSRP